MVSEVTVTKSNEYQSLSIMPNALRCSTYTFDTSTVPLFVISHSLHTSPCAFQITSYNYSHFIFWEHHSQQTASKLHYLHNSICN